MDNNNIIDSTTIKKKFLCGYQGWFGAKGDGSKLNNWDHWSSTPGRKPNERNVVADMWPDLREFDDDELFETNFKFKDGTKARLYSAYNEKSILRHLQWMKEYGIDGVVLYRFVTAVNAKSEINPKQEHRDKVLQNIKKGCETHGRVFLVKYDISDTAPGSLLEDIKNDWKYLIDHLKITGSDRYLHEQGRPVVSLSGFGYRGRPGTPGELEELINWFHNTDNTYRATILGAVPKKWNTPGWEDYTKWNTVFKKFDIICPWATNRFTDDAGADSYRHKYLEPEFEECKKNNIIYMPVIFPGFSWHNLKRGKKPRPEINSTPRNGGKFFWRQAYNAVDAGVPTIFAAMFDEVNEGTALFKLAENKEQVPGEGDFLTLDADSVQLKSDWYLRLCGETAKMMRGEIPISKEIPIA